MKTRNYKYSINIDLSDTDVLSTCEFNYLAEIVGKINLNKEINCTFNWKEGKTILIKKNHKKPMSIYAEYFLKKLSKKKIASPFEIVN